MFKGLVFCLAQDIQAVNILISEISVNKVPWVAFLNSPSGILAFITCELPDLGLNSGLESAVLQQAAKEKRCSLAYLLVRAEPRASPNY